MKEPLRDFIDTQEDKEIDNWQSRYNMLDQIEKIKFMEKMNTIQWFPNFPEKDD